MSYLLEILLQGVFEVVCYGVGRAVLLIVAPHYLVGSFEEERKHPWRWRGWRFERDGRRYFYAETVELVGLLVVAALVAMITLAIYLQSLQPR